MTARQTKDLLRQARESIDAVRLHGQPADALASFSVGQLLGEIDAVLGEESTAGGGGRRTLFIVWNEAKSEGALFDNEKDARACATGQFELMWSALGESFAEIYEDDIRTVEAVEVDVAAPGGSRVVDATL